MVGRSAQESPPVTFGTPTLGWDDHLPFHGAPTLAPLNRLARVGADGAIRRVSPGELVDVPRVYAVVHGWAPGSRSAADLIYARTGTQPRAWDDGMVDLFGFSIADAFLPLLSAIAARDPDAAVLWFSWVDESATAGEMFAGRESLRHTQINGARLAHALVEACAPVMPPVHLIGHSHGGVVAANAALALPTAPAQLTLLDTPEDWLSRVGGSAGQLARVLPRLEPGRGRGRVFVDSYTSMFGRPYHRRPGLSEVVDVRLAGALRRRDARGAVGDAHEYALDWYTATAQSADPRCGFGWSVLAARGAARAAGTVVGFDPEALAAGYLVRGDRKPVVVSRRPSPARPHQQEEVPLGIAELELSAQRPDVSVGITLSGADLVLFDYEIAPGSDRSRVEGAVNRVLEFSGAGDEFEVPPRGRFLSLPGNPDVPSAVLLHFRLVEPGTTGTAVIRNLRAVRAGQRTRNYDSTMAAAAIAATGAVAGSVATLALQRLARAARSRVTRS